MSRIILEIDAATLGTALTSMEMDRSPNGCLFKQIREFMFSNFVHCIVSICSRLCNRVADSLAAHGACNLESNSHMYLSQAPDFCNGSGFRRFVWNRCLMKTSVFCVKKRALFSR
jgi:hypothetical protein